MEEEVPDTTSATYWPWVVATFLNSSPSYLFPLARHLWARIDLLLRGLPTFGSCLRWGRQLKPFALRTQPPSKRELPVTWPAFRSWPLVFASSGGLGWTPVGWDGHSGTEQGWALAKTAFPPPGKGQRWKFEWQQIPKDFGAPLPRCSFHVKWNAV